MFFFKKFASFSKKNNFDTKVTYKLFFDRIKIQRLPALILRLTRNSFLAIYFLNTYLNPLSYYTLSFLKFKFFSSFLWVKILNVFVVTVGEGFIYMRGLLLLFLTDACLTDDEPI